MKSFIVQPWNQRVYVSSDPARVIARYNRHSDAEEKMTLDELENCRGMAIHLQPKGKCKTLFLLFLSPSWDPTHFADLQTLHHEALHMGHFLMEYCGQPINMDSTETQAYLMEHIAERARRKML